jgi:hypothetical protein
MFTNLKNVKCKVMKCTLSAQIPCFCAISHTGTITLQYEADDDDDGSGNGDGGGGDGIHILILFQAVAEVSYETLQVLPTYVRTI